MNNFVLPVVVTEEFLAELFDSIYKDPKTEVEVNLPEQTITNKATGKSEHFEINAYKKDCLINGLDDIDYLLANKSKIEAFEQHADYDRNNGYHLRDGEQTSGVSFAAHEKLSIAQALLDLGVNRLEIASARVSDGEFEAVKRVASWAERTGNIQKLEVLGFVDGDVSLNWIERRVVVW